MMTFHRLGTLAVGASLSLAACASQDTQLRDQRSLALYGVPQERSSSTYDVGAEPAPAAPPVESLEAYIEHGLQHSPELRASYESWRASTERAEQVASLPEPKLSYSEFIEQVQTRTGPQQRRFGLSQAFPWPGELGARGEVEERKADAGWQRVELVRLKVVESIESSYYRYAFLARELEIIAEQLELMLGLEPILRGRIRTGGGQGDLLRLQVEIGRLEDEAASLQARRASLSARLAQAARLPQILTLLPLPQLELPQTSPLDRARLHERAGNFNPGLRAALADLDAGQAAAGLADFSGLPRFSLMLDYIQTGNASNPGTPGSGDDPIMLGVSLSLPIWGSSYDAAEREARHRVRAARQRHDAAQVALSADLEDAIFRVEDAARRIGLYRDSLLPRARESFELTLAAYRTAGASVLDVIDSERALLAFQLSMWRACRDYYEGRAHLNNLTGGEQR